MNKTQLAKRLGIARQSLNDLESNELSESITLASLSNVAKALGCDLQYTLVPRKPLEKLIAEQAVKKATRKLGRVNQSQALEAAAIHEAPLSKVIADLAKEIEIIRPADLWND